jgi:hypothetical protein
VKKRGYPLLVMALEILKSDIDRSSGHITVQVRVVEKHADGHISHGPLETVGIDHASLTTRYNCPHTATPAEVEACLTKWLAEHHAGAVLRKRALEHRSGVVVGMAGKTLNFGEDS